MHDSECPHCIGAGCEVCSAQANLIDYHIGKLKLTGTPPTIEDTVDALKAENARLREALGCIIRHPFSDRVSMSEGSIRVMAQEALNPTEVE